MAIALKHDTAADGTFSADGATHWNAAHAWSGLGTNQLLYSTGATTLAQSSALTFDGVSLTVNALKLISTSIPSGAAFYEGNSSAVIEFGSTTPTLRFDQAVLYGVGNLTIQWGNQTNTFASSSPDTSLNRGGAAVVRVGDGGNNANGSIQCKYKSSDGTAGLASFSGAVTSITVKDGIITAAA